jgi:hypothetical protein
MTERKTINLVFTIVVLAVTALLFVPAWISNAILHNRLDRIESGMTEGEASAILGKEYMTSKGGDYEIMLSDKSSPLAFIFPSLEVREFHVVKISTGRVVVISQGGWMNIQN